MRRRQRVGLIGKLEDRFGNQEAAEGEHGNQAHAAGEAGEKHELRNLTDAPYQNILVELKTPK